MTIPFMFKLKDWINIHGRRIQSPQKSPPRQTTQATQTLSNSLPTQTQTTNNPTPQTQNLQFLNPPPQPQATIPPISQMPKLRPKPHGLKSQMPKNSQTHSTKSQLLNHNSHTPQHIHQQTPGPQDNNNNKRKSPDNSPQFPSPTASSLSPQQPTAPLLSPQLPILPVPIPTTTSNVIPTLRFLEWCEQQQIQPMYTVTIHVPPPFNQIFTSVPPTTTLQTAESSACDVAYRTLAASLAVQPTLTITPTSPAIPIPAILPTTTTSVPPTATFIPAGSETLTSLDYNFPYSVPAAGGLPANSFEPPTKQAKTTSATAYDKNPISTLKELCDKRKWPTPVYETVRTEGPPHQRLFLVQVSLPSIGSFVCDRGYANIQLARSHAASLALQHLLARR